MSDQFEAPKIGVSESFTPFVKTQFWVLTRQWLSKTYTHVKEGGWSYPLYPKLNLWFIGVG